MAQKMITSTDDPLYINAIVHLANLLEEKTFGTPLGVSAAWKEKFTGTMFCPDGCINGRCPGHRLTVNLAEVRKHPQYKSLVYHSEVYSNGKHHNVIHFYEEVDKAERQFNELCKRAK